MTSKQLPIVASMQLQLRQWQRAADRRAIFLNCYLLMTQNMLQAIEAGEFIDGPWVHQLLHRFAEYYFEALAAYQQKGAAAPAVWQQVHDVTLQSDVDALRLLLLGVNAHINYDLVLTLAELLALEATALKPPPQRARYGDHCRVNTVIGRTIDSVQDQVLNPAAPMMKVIDPLLGRLDEWFTARLISHWRDEVWQNAMQMLQTSAPAERELLRRRVELATLRRADSILGGDKR